MHSLKNIKNYLPNYEKCQIKFECINQRKNLKNIFMTEKLDVIFKLASIINTTHMLIKMITVIMIKSPI